MAPNAFIGFKIMPQIGSEKNPIRMSPHRTTKLRGQYLKNEDKAKYDSNYDRIFGSKTEFEIARETSKTFSAEQS